MHTLGTKQKLVFDYLREKLQSGVPPTFREICTYTGIKSTSTISAILEQLEEMGYISRDPRFSRAIRIEGQQNVVHIPLVGRVTAGVPILAQEQIEDYLPVSAALARSHELFALRVVGDSMKNAGIFDGDIVVSEKTEVAENGDIVIAMLEEEATVKRFFLDPDGVRLMPENPDYAPIISPDISVLGRVIASMRFYARTAHRR
jgi:repressor LexA